MPCYHPSEVAVERKALPGIPRRVEAVKVPCGSCLGCRTDQARQWAIRISHEAETHQSRAWFVTLTYSDEEIPEDGSLRPRDPQLFVKRLRKRVPELRYYLCGEYGSRTQRPHYHAVLFGPDLPRDFVSQSSVRGGVRVWTCDLLTSTWPHGLHEFSTVTWASASYVAGYVRAKARLSLDPYQYTRVNPLTGELHELEPEFARMSRRPAVGRRWIERHYADVYPRDFVMMNGSPVNPPRYYDRWLEDHHPALMEEVRFQRWKDSEEIGDPQLIIRERVHRAKLNLFNRRDTV